MGLSDNWHRNLGVYGICTHEGKILVIHKNKGPYKNRFDLPGGNIEPNESLSDALHREFAEETGFEIEITRNIGVSDYVVPYMIHHRETTHIHHIAIYYEVKIMGNLASPIFIVQNDAIGTEWIELGAINDGNASPLVSEAVEWIVNKTRLPIGINRLDDWKIN